MALGRENSTTVIKSANSGGMSTSEARIIIDFGCFLKVRIKFRSFREIEISCKNLLKSFSINKAGLSEVSFSTNSKACKGFLAAKP